MEIIGGIIYVAGVYSGLFFAKQYYLNSFKAYTDEVVKHYREALLNRDSDNCTCGRL